MKELIIISILAILVVVAMRSISKYRQRANMYKNAFNELITQIIKNGREKV